MLAPVGARRACSARSTSAPLGVVFYRAAGGYALSRSAGNVSPNALGALAQRLAAIRGPVYVGAWHVHGPL